MEKICMVSLHTENIQCLADMTWNANKLLYCQKYNYDYRLRVQKQSYQVPNGVPIIHRPVGAPNFPYVGFDKILFIHEVVDEGKFDWIFWCDCDTLVTNFSSRIEGIIEMCGKEHDVLLACDYSNVNAGVFLLKTSKKGLAYLQLLKNKMYEFAETNQFLFGEEQTAIQKTYQYFPDVVKVLPQRVMNSYPYDVVYGHPNGYPDIFGQNGNWQAGDFMIHIPGFGPDLFHKRMEHFKHFIQKVQQ